MKIKEFLNDKKNLFGLCVIVFMLLFIISGAILLYNRNATYRNGKLDEATERTYTDAKDTNRRLEQTNQELSDIFTEIRNQKHNQE